jgi:hypothetical protein
MNKASSRDNNYTSSYSKFKKLKKDVREDYLELKYVYCPYFGEKVYFSSEGFKHMFFRGLKKLKERDFNSKFMRLKLFKFAPKLLRITKTLQEYCTSHQFIPVEFNKRKEKILKLVKYWGFIAIIDDRRIKVIIKQIGNGKKKFWSIIPNWITRKTGRGNQIISHTGDLEND